MADYLGTMFSDWFTSFVTVLCPDNEFLRINPTLISFWGHTVKHGPSQIIDPKGNILILELSKTVGRLHFISGALKIAKFYSLSTDHAVVMNYMGENLFHIGIIDMNFIEIQYPVLNVKHEHPTFFSNNFFRTLNPNEDYMHLGAVFQFFWKDDLSCGDANLTDPTGNTLFLELAEDPNGFLMFSSGVKEMAEFYQLKTEHEAWIHYVGANNFALRIFSFDEVEIPYPIAIDNHEASAQFEGVVEEDIENQLDPLIEGFIGEGLENQNGHQVEEVVDEHIGNQHDRIEKVIDNQNGPQIDVVIDVVLENQHNPHIEEVNHNQHPQNGNQRGWIKIITASHAKGKQTLMIPANLVENILLPIEQTNVILLQDGGQGYECTIMGGKRRQNERYIGSGWNNFVKVNIGLWGYALSMVRQ